MNRECIEQIASAYYNEIYRFCLRKLSFNEQDAKDVVQEVFLVLQKMQRDISVENLRGWLYSTAEKKLYEFYKRQRRENEKKSAQQLESEPYYEPDFDKLIELEISEEELARRREAVIARLEEKDKILFEQIFVQKLSNAELAEKMKISENTVCIRKCRLKFKITKIVKMLFSVIF